MGSAFDTLPSELVADWVYGWKLGSLAFDPEDKVWGFIGHYGRFSALDSVAQCDIFGHAFKDAKDCRCGHYHLPDPPQVASSSTLVRVATTGTIYEYAATRRAERQVITDVWLPSACALSDRWVMDVVKVSSRKAARTRRKHPDWDGFETRWVGGKKLPGCNSVNSYRLASSYNSMSVLIGVCHGHAQMGAMDLLDLDELSRSLGVAIHPGPFIDARR